MSTTFGTRDEAWHTMMTKSVNRLYTMTSVLRFEALVDDTLQLFVEKLKEKFASEKKACAIDKWLHFCKAAKKQYSAKDYLLTSISLVAWDVIGHVTFSKDLGFMSSESDVDSLIDTGERAVDYFAVVGQIPFLDKLFDKNPVYRVGPPSFGSAAGYSAKRLFARISGEDGHDPSKQEDFLDLFLEAKKQDPEMDDNRMIAYLMSNVVAGSDTTAIELRACIYHLCKNKHAMKALQAELDRSGVTTSGRPVQWKDTPKLPYLDAVVREALRVHPAVGLPLERVVPSSGLQLKDGRFLPGGTVVGMNPVVIHHDEAIYGSETDKFKPERWLRQEGESEEAHEKRVAKMKETDLTFGFGKRICTGRWVAIMEVYKCIGTLLKEFDVRLVDESKEWKVKNSWFVRQWDMDVYLTPRST